MTQLIILHVTIWLLFNYRSIIVHPIYASMTYRSGYKNKHTNKRQQQQNKKKTKQKKKTTKTNKTNKQTNNFHLVAVSIILAPDCCRLLSSPNKQSGKYNEMDPILIGTAVSEQNFIREMSKPAVPLVKALWQTNIFINIHDYVITNSCYCCRPPKPGRKQDFYQHPRWRIEIYLKML